MVGTYRDTRRQGPEGYGLRLRSQERRIEALGFGIDDGRTLHLSERAAPCRRDEYDARSAGLGAQIEMTADRTVQVQARTLGYVAPEAAVRRMRASIQIMGPLLARLGRVRVASPADATWGHGRSTYT